MMTLRENAMAIYNGEKPDFYGDIMDAVELIPDPVLMGDLPPQDGFEHEDSWGTVYVFKPGAPGPHPRVNDSNAVIKDIEHWKEQLKVPSLENLDWTAACQAAQSVNRKEKFVGFMCAGGLFERSHHLMGMENALINYMEYPEEMACQAAQSVNRKEKFVGFMCAGGLFERSHHLMGMENALINYMEYPEEMAGVLRESVNRKEKFVGFMCAGGLFERSHHLMGMENALINYMEYPEEMAGVLREIAEYKKTYIRLVAEKIHPDIIFYHDDWGSKQNLFLPPRIWRALIKPLQKEISDVIHECGMIYMHHADCICQPIVEDMVEIGVDIWQGVIAQNDIVEIHSDVIHECGMIYMHHADCICQPIVEDMVEIGVDIWQGVIAQNDIVEIQRITKGKLAMCGGIDGPKIDIENITEEEIRREVRRAIDTYCRLDGFIHRFQMAYVSANGMILL